MLVGVAALVGSAAVPGPSARRVGGNAPLKAPDPLDATAENSPALAANPRDARNLALAARVDVPQFSCALHVSFDRAAHWTQVPIPLPPGKSVSCFAPDLAFGADGTLYLAFTTFAEVPGQGVAPDAAWLVTSGDGGRTLSLPARIAGPLAFQLRLAADPATARRLYVTWLQATETARWGLPDEGNPVMVSTSDDGGASWQAPVRVTPPERREVVAPVMAVGPRGVLFLAYLDVGSDRLDYAGAHEGKAGVPYAGSWALVVARSADRGATWEESVVEPKLVPTERFLMLFPAAPSLAVDPAGGRLYVGFQDGRLGDADVFVWGSSDDGRRWGRPKRVNDTRAGDGSEQSLPALAVAPGGRLDVVYYDRRSDPAGIRTEVSLQSSDDHGASFKPRLALSDRSFDSRIGFGGAQGIPDLGHRLGVLATPDGALGVWSDTRAGTQGSRKQDLARAVVRLRSAPLHGGLRRAGWAAMALGLGFGAVVGVRRLRRPSRAGGTTSAPVEAT